MLLLLPCIISSTVQIECLNILLFIEKLFVLFEVSFELTFEQPGAPDISHSHVRCNNNHPNVYKKGNL